MSEPHVAQLNVGVMVAPTDDPAVAEFMDNLDRINAQADAAPGFVWRLQTESGNATDIQIFANPLQLVNMSVWESVDELKTYVYRTEHVDFFRRRTEWFERDGKRVVLWHVATGSTPALDEAVRRLEFLEHHGPTAYAFGFAKVPEPVVFEHAGSTASVPPVAEVAGSEDVEVAVTAFADGRVIGWAGTRLIDGEPVDVLHVDPESGVEHLHDALVDQLGLVAARRAQGTPAG